MLKEKIQNSNESFICEMLALFEDENTSKYDKTIACVEAFENELWEFDIEIDLYESAKLVTQYEKIHNIKSKKLFLEKYIVKKLYSLENL